MSEKRRHNPAAEQHIQCIACGCTGWHSGCAGARFVKSLLALNAIRLTFQGR